MNKNMLLLLTILSCSAHAEVFKCVIDHKTEYQSEPCSGKAVKQAEIVLETPDPAKEAEKQARLQAWEADFAKREAEEQKLRQEQAAERLKQSEINALTRSARAQEEMAAAARQPIIIREPMLFQPLYAPPFYRHPHYPYSPRHEEREERNESSARISIKIK